MTRLVAFLFVEMILGCQTPQSTGHRYIGKLPGNHALDMSGSYSLLPNGDVKLALRGGCMIERSKVTRSQCTLAELDQIPVTAATPWGSIVVGKWLDATHIVFHPDWSHTGIRQLAEDAVVIASRPWYVSGGEWQPAPTDVQAMLARMGEATETETALVSGDPPPKLEIAAVDVDGALSAGHTGKLAVRVTNRGEGIAFRVVATTRSSMPALHGRRLEFGSLKPGATKAREVRFDIPRDESSPDVMVIVMVEEGNGFTPASVNRRWQLVAAMPELATTCAVKDHPAQQLTINAGERVTVRCIVTNTGNSAAMASLSASGPGIDIRSKPQSVEVGKRIVFELLVSLPRDLTVGSTLQLLMTTSDERQGSVNQTTITAEIAKPLLCVTGSLSRKQYDAKIAELRAALRAGDMTQPQFDRYDGELLLCLK